MPSAEQEQRRASKRERRNSKAVAVPPPPLLTVEELFNQSQEDLDKKRDEFEDLSKDSIRSRLRDLVKTSSAQTEVQIFLQMMRDKGGGSVAVAWRRYFDSDGDGELDFKEFCGALIEMNYTGNVLSLWADLRRAKAAPEEEGENLRLEDLDKDSAAVLEYFGHWCSEQFGGPAEAFRVMDDDGSDSLTREEFAEGLTALGFFNSPGVPKSISTEDAVTDNLFPLLDQNGTGACACEQLMFLEKDPVKKAKVLRQLARMREGGIEGAAEPLRNNAQRLLHQLAIQTTPLGGKPWQLVTAKVAIGEEWYPKKKTAMPAKLHRKGSSSRFGLTGNMVVRQASVTSLAQTGDQRAFRVGVASPKGASREGAAGLGGGRPHSA